MPEPPRLQAIDGLDGGERGNFRAPHLTVFKVAEKKQGPNSFEFQSLFSRFSSYFLLFAFRARAAEP